MNGATTNGFLRMCFVLCVAIVGCDLFQTREPDQPGGSSSTFIPPTSHGDVITNLQNAVGEKNKENYRRCLVDTNFSDRTFQFQPTAEAAGKYAGAFNDWSVAMEEQYFRNLSESKAGSVPGLYFFDPQTPSQTSDEVVFTAKYHLVFHHQNASLAQEARGNLQFFIARDRRSEWSIYRWIDLGDTSETTWSDFKANFR